MHTLWYEYSCDITGGHPDAACVDKRGSWGDGFIEGVDKILEHKSTGVVTLIQRCHPPPAGKKNA